MATEEIFEKLKNLQVILKKKYELQDKIEEAPKQVSFSEQALAKSKKEYIARNAEYEQIKDQVAKLNFELDEAVRSRENGEKGMDNITTHREFEALEKQIIEATDKENEVRKELQKQEKILAELNEDLKAKESGIQFDEEELSKSRAALNSALEEYNNELNDLQKQEDEITPNLQKEILFKFERIIQRNSKGIVAVRYNKDAKGHVCTGCNMVLPHQFANTVRKGEDIIFCPYCSRILDFEITENEEEEEYFTVDDLGSLYSDEDDESLGELGELGDLDESDENSEYTSDEDTSSDYYDEESEDDEREDDDSDMDEDSDDDDDSSDEE